MKKILIVDDDRVFRKILKDGLLVDGSQKYNIETALDGKEALELMQHSKPDLIILDIVMPKMGGVEALSEIKKDSTLKNIPVLIGTQLSDIDSMSRVVELGVVGYIIKSEFSLANIIKQINRILDDIK